MNSQYKITKKSMLGVDAILVEGPQGIGKTNAIASFLNDDYKYHHKTRTKQAEDFCQDLKKYGYKLSVKGKHLYYSNIPIFLDKKQTVKTWSCDFSGLALPNDEFEVDYFPPWSVIFLTEVDSQASCRDWQKFSKFFILFFKYFRHMHYTIVMDLQVGEMLEKTVRILSTRKMSVYDSYNKYGIINKSKIKSRVTKFISVNPQLLEFSRSLRKLEGSLKVGQAEKMFYKYKGNPFKQYNSFSGIPYFLYKIKEWTFKEHKETDLSPEGVKKYRELHPLELPEAATGKKKK